ncbi:butyryl-CoA:acetoacetate CoA-transferase alpha subunit [Austwickia chelonae]|uniref:Putative 3-oxoacid CoA-transferase subunit A n=1 Tax=Austwickia chelonae NBRC 105200 TaxID=1184607 RepID=K6V7K3_9MICO|nr:3-oxoacid CoA-transferase subunit A [Austwickia chelonae]GAB78208.1 putative 3-oxoacid CoA-transferase subunit A [Austwickia chelonae NBRC 105200]SEV98719.1 butyryl-CoA:acetoacetate CoA-transferase alpha subunit [Austwickia chelonae]
MDKVIGLDRFVELVEDGMTVMVGGFLACGGPNMLMDALVAKGTKDLTLIANDMARPTVGLGQLVANRQVRKVIASHIGMNPEVAAQMNAGTLDVELVPQGTLAERIRAAGSGLGGVLTRTGLGTLVADGKPVVTVDDIDYLLETPLKADLALISGHTVDRSGNIWYKGTARNFNDVMALAATTVVVEADHVVEIGAIEPENVVTPNVLVDYVVEGKN